MSQFAGGMLGRSWECNRVLPDDSYSPDRSLHCARLRTLSTLRCCSCKLAITPKLPKNHWTRRIILCMADARSGKSSTLMSPTTRVFIHAEWVQARKKKKERETEIEEEVFKQGSPHGKYFVLKQFPPFRNVSYMNTRARNITDGQQGTLTCMIYSPRTRLS